MSRPQSHRPELRPDGRPEGRFVAVPAPTVPGMSRDLWGGAFGHETARTSSQYEEQDQGGLAWLIPWLAKFETEEAWGSINARNSRHMGLAGPFVGPMFVQDGLTVLDPGSHLLFCASLAVTLVCYTETPPNPGRGKASKSE